MSRSERGYVVKGHQFDWFLCDRNEAGEIESGNIVARLNRIGAVVFSHPGPWKTERDAQASMREQVRKIAERYS